MKEIDSNYYDINTSRMFKLRDSNGALVCVSNKMFEYGCLLLEMIRNSMQLKVSLFINLIFNRTYKYLLFIYILWFFIYYYYLLHILSIFM